MKLEAAVPSSGQEGVLGMKGPREVGRKEMPLSSFPHWSMPWVLILVHALVRYTYPEVWARISSH